MTVKTVKNKNILILLLAIVLAFLSAWAVKQKFKRFNPWKRYLVGAYYYLWYPENFKLGYLGRYLEVERKPQLGEYSLSDVEIFEKHISLCSRYGIDFLSFSWWPRWYPGREKLDKILLSNISKAKNIEDIKFCIFYETYALGYAPETAKIVFDAKKIELLLKDCEYLSKNYFNHPSYLKIEGKPVMILYLTRCFSGDYKRAINLIRKKYNLYLIADEIFWDEFNKERTKLFDAVTAYNMYNAGNTGHKGFAVQTTYLTDVYEKYSQYYDFAREHGIKFVANIIPGFNDRGVRRQADHYVLPRQFKPEAPATSLFEVSLDRLVKPFLGQDKGDMFLITSWNEWNEDTQIEPAQLSASSNRDKSRTAYEFTQGYYYSGYGTNFLEVLRDEMVAVHGRISENGNFPFCKRKVYLLKGKKLIAITRTNSLGYYTISRYNIPDTAGEYTLSLLGKDKHIPVKLNNNKSIKLDINV